MTPDSKRHKKRRVTGEVEAQPKSEVTAEARRVISHADPSGPVLRGPDRLMWTEHRNTELLFLKIGRGTSDDA